jgi:hypothetical protein
MFDPDRFGKVLLEFFDEATSNKRRLGNHGGDGVVNLWLERLVLGEEIIEGDFHASVLYVL